MDEGDPTVGQYMTRDVSTVSPTETVASVARRIAESEDHNGFPVTDDGHVVGFVSASDLLLADEDSPIHETMSEDLLVAAPDMAVTDAARVILRSGIQKLPVVDEDGALVGIITNADVIRSQIERATPEKVGKLLRTLESIHDVEAREERRTVDLADLVPTQSEVYADELEGRRYELERGLAEPLVVIDPGGRGSEEDTNLLDYADTDEAVDDEWAEDGRGHLLLGDGHHRVLAARRLGVESMDAYVIVLEESVELGMARSAARQGLRSVEDVSVVDYARHPLVETTERFQ